LRRGYPHRRPSAVSSDIAAHAGRQIGGELLGLARRWRDGASNFKPVPGAVEYLRFLAANGYGLSPIELVVTGERTADVVYQEAMAAAA
jgi:hypothetical protein